MSKRIYAVTYTPSEGDTVWLVRATTAAAARNHIVKRFLTVEVASQETLVSALQDGLTVEDANSDEQASTAGSVPDGDTVWPRTAEDSGQPHQLDIERDIPPDLDRRVPRQA